jgi:hypothetical protein
MMLDDDQYTEEELDGLNTWIPLANDQLPSWPIRFYFAKLKSGSPESDELILDPKNALLEGAGSLAPLADEAINADTQITTTIFRHDRSLKLRLRITVAAVDSQDNSVSMTSHKVVDLPPD